MNEGNLERGYWNLVVPYWLHLNEAWDFGADEFLSRLRTVPLKVRHLYSAHWCLSEVENGGLHQFFSNTTGLIAPEAVEALKTIGLQGCSTVLVSAMEYFRPPYPRERELRLLELPDENGKRKDWDPFVSLDREFYDFLEAQYGWQRAADAYAAIA